MSIDVAKNPDSRIHYLDNLRALAMMLGVFLHAGLAYAQPSQSVWLATDPGSSRLVDVGIWFIHLFRMALFFVISGYFAKMLIERKGIANFLRNRFVRIAVPFILFYPVLLGLMAACIVFAISYVKNPTGLMGIIAEAAKMESSNHATRPWSTMHLWFLYYLMIFSLLAPLLTRLPPVRWDWFKRRPWFALLAPMILVPGSMAGGVPMAAPESFVPHAWAFSFYGFFYLAGWSFFGRESSMESLGKFTIPLSILAVCLFVPYYCLMPHLDIRKLESMHRNIWIAEGVLGSYLSALLVLLALLLGRRLLNRHSLLFRYISDSSYWVYLVHLPIVILFQTLLINTSLPVWSKLGICIFATLLVCWMTYLALVRYTPIGWLLNGKRPFP